ncbi:MAG TPA: hypothetical protein DEP84_26770 [Chloroflexi bacterium]|nr:hypothetical protein [Chloroflexota bacterium]
MDEALITLDNVSVHFPVRTGFLSKPQIVHALDQVNLTVREGEVLGVVGESGCGKSTLGRVILGLQQPTHGTVFVNGDIIRTNIRPGALAKRFGFQMVFQDPASSFNPRMRVRSIIAEPLSGLQLSSAQIAGRVNELLEDVGLDSGFADKYPEELSGGQQQRVAIARALAPEPRLIVLDEAVSALDMSTQAKVLNLLKDLKDKYGVTYIFISHDIASVKFMSTRIVVMYLGHVVEIAGPQGIHEEALHPYTICLHSAVPFPDSVIERTRTRIIPEGSVPSPISPPHGCRFHTRCPIAQDKCSREEPLLMEYNERGFAACHYAGQFERLFEQRRKQQHDPFRHTAIG